MYRTFKQLVVTIRSNPVAALTVVVGIAVIVLDLVGSVSLEVYLNVILASLALLLFRDMRARITTPDLDAVLEDRTSLPNLLDFIKGARALWIYAPSGINILANAPFFRSELLERGGEFRMMLQDLQESDYVEALSRQLDTDSALAKDIDLSLDRLRKLTANRNWNAHYRLLGRSPGFSIVIVDPYGRDGRLYVEFFGYRNETINQRMHITIHKDASQHWFDYWVGVYERMWDDAREETSSHKAEV